MIVKRQGVINQPLSSALAGLGHGDYFLLCDAGFPIPKDVERIDLALTFGVPTMEQCLKAILTEINIQQVTYAQEMWEYNRQGAEYLDALFQAQKKECVPQNDLAELARNAKFIVRSGEVACYSNVILEAASGVEQFKKMFELNVF